MELKFDAPPTLATFMKSELYGRIAAGPVGSGKTTACVIELLRRAINQTPGEDGLSHTRFAVVRQTLKQLKDTVLKDCQGWLGGIGEWKVSEGTFHVNFDHVKSEWIFIPLENAEDQARLLSMQLTGAWLSECIEMNLDVLAPLSGRIGRYPSGRQGAPTWYGMIADTNMPTEMSPWHQFMENMPANWQKFIQPGGMEWNAENLNFLLQSEETKKLPFNDPARIAKGRMYYQNLINMYGEDSDWVQRYVHAKYGNDPSGAAVFRNTFKASFHVVDKVNVIPGYPLIIGQDFGRNPWSLICQLDHVGRLVVIEEVPGVNVGLEKHVVQSLRPILWNRYNGMKVFVVGDPAGVAKDSISEESPFEAMTRLGIPAFKAPTNEIEPRLRAVERLLGTQVNGGPGLMISREGCPFLVRAMSGGYRFIKTKQGALKAKPDKNDPEGFSHPVDDLQYVALVVNGGLVQEYSIRLKPRTRTNRQKITAQSWT